MIATELALEGAANAERGLDVWHGATVVASNGANAHIEGAALSQGESLAYAGFSSGVFMRSGSIDGAAFFGAIAEHDSMIDAAAATVQNTTLACLHSNRGSHIVGPGATMTNCGTNGVRVGIGSTAHFEQASIETDWCATATAVCSISPFGTQSGSSRLASKGRSAVSATATTMLWRSR